MWWATWVSGRSTLANGHDGETSRGSVDPGSEPGGGARLAVDTLQPGGPHPRAGPWSPGAGAGAVSRRKCSIAAITAAASSGEADEPCNSRRGRRFTARTLAGSPDASPLSPRLPPSPVPRSRHRAHADPAGRTTLEETLGPAAGSGYIGRRPRARSTSCAAAAPRRQASAPAKRRSLLFFVQLTDPQIADEMSPARVDFVDPAGGELEVLLAPAGGARAAGVRLRSCATSTPTARSRGEPGQRQAGASTAFAITTGDLADNQQLNETRWFTTVLDGGRVDPFSGKPVTTECGDSRRTRSRASTPTSPRRNYTGVAGLRRLPRRARRTASPASRTRTRRRRPPARTRRSRATPACSRPPSGRSRRGPGHALVHLARQPRRPGPGQRARQQDLFRAIAAGCLKVFPNSAFDPKRFEGASDDELFAAFGDPAFIQQLLAGGKTVAARPGPPRHLQARVPGARRQRQAHGFGYTPKAQLKQVRRHGELLRVLAQEGLPLHLARHGRRGRRPERQHRRPAVQLAAGRAARAPSARASSWSPSATTRSRRWTTRARTSSAGKCDPADEPGCDRDPRKSTPLHRGLAGKKSIRALFAANPNVIAYVSGHTHANRVDFFKGRRAAASGRSTPPRTSTGPSRAALIEVMDNRDGTLSLFGTLLDSAAPAAAPAPGTSAPASPPAQLASLGRTLSFNDPQREGLEGSGGDGRSAAGGPTATWSCWCRTRARRLATGSWPASRPARLSRVRR